MPYAPLRRTMTPLGRVFGVTPWWLSGGISASACVAAYAPKGASSYAASKTNLANPGTYDAAEGVAPTWSTSVGWTFNGSTQYLTTGVVPTATGTAIVCVNSLTNNCSLFGCERTTTSSYMGIYRHATNGLQYANVDSGTAYKAPAVSAGVFAVAGRNSYRNGVLDATLPAALTMNRSMLVACRCTSSGTVIEFMAGNMVALAIYNTTLDAATIATLTTAMNGL